MAKQCGIAPVAVMRFIFCLAFTGKNLFRYLQADPAGNEIGKDTVYRFLNSVNANWRKFLHLLSAAVIRKQILPLTSEQTPKVFIVDDSLYNRNRSKKVEPRQFEVAIYSSENIRFFSSSMTRSTTATAAKKWSFWPVSTIITRIATTAGSGC